MDSSPPPNRTHPRGPRARQARHTIIYLHALPIELWVACWALCSRQQLHRLSLVCRLFRGICLPLLFERHSIDVGWVWQGLCEKNRTDRLHRLHRAAVRLDALAASPYIISTIHSWKFTASHVLPFVSERPRNQLFGTTYNRVLSTFSSTLTLYHNLRSIYLHGLVIDVPFRESVAYLSRLDDLILSSCDITARNGSVLNLASFRISGRPLRRTDSEKSPVSQEPLRIVSPLVLRKLYAEAPDNITPLFRAFAHGQFLQLVLLLLHLRTAVQLDEFFEFLKQCPRLEVLTVTLVDWSLVTALPKYNLPATTTPLLRDLTGPRELFSLLTPNRPIMAANIMQMPMNRRRQRQLPYMSSEDVMGLFNDLLRASVPLLSLSIPVISPTLNILSVLASSFSHVRELSIHLSPPMGLFCEQFTNYGFQPDPLDLQYPPILNDALAFENISEEDLSDGEEDEPPSIVLVQVPTELKVPTSTDLHNILAWILSGSASLPPDIEVLGLLWDEKLVLHFPLVMEHEVITVFAPLYPQLREVRMGYSTDRIWKWDGAVWRKTGGQSYIRVAQH